MHFQANYPTPFNPVNTLPGSANQNFQNSQTYPIDYFDNTFARIYDATGSPVSGPLNMDFDVSDKGEINQGIGACKSFFALK